MGFDLQGTTPTAIVDINAFAAFPSFRLRNQAGAPSSPLDGMLYNDNSNHHLWFYDGTAAAWQQLDRQATTGQTTLVSGTKAITISGLTTSSRAFVTLVSPSGASSTVQYQAVCTSNTLTIQANVAAGTINTSDSSTINYQTYQ